MLYTLNMDITKTNLSTLTDFEIDGVDRSDYPKFCDAFISKASYADGTELTDEELDFVNADSSFVYETVIDHLY